MWWHYISVLENVISTLDGLVLSSNDNIDNDNDNNKNIDTKIYHEIDSLCMINFSVTSFPELCPRWLINPGVANYHQI